MWLTNLKRRWISRLLATPQRQALAQHVELNESLVGGDAGADCGREKAKRDQVLMFNFCPLLQQRSSRHGAALKIKIVAAPTLDPPDYELRIPPDRTLSN